MIITVTFILFLAGLLFFGSLPFIAIYSKRKKEKICKQLSKAGAAKGLIFCSQEILQNKVLGFDGIHRKIMIIENKNHTYDTSIISLDDVQQCQLVTPDGAFDPANCGNTGRKIRKGSLELRFQFNNPHQTASINFTNGLISSKRELALLRAKAEYWCIMFSKMVNPHAVVRA